MANSCGSCTLCCKLLGVPELTDPAEWCRHCTPGKGCGIYNDRPVLCREFECGWLANDGDPQLRPDRIHMVVTGEIADFDAYVIHVDPDYPDAPDRTLAKAMLETIVKYGRHQNIVLVTGKTRKLIGNFPADIEKRFLAMDQKYYQRKG
jgi:uncharacterized protein